ncbi:PBP1A family penicillin-binding protein [Solibacillus sp. CAU 1738]|uniref:transglycosylase domain-containing protein n=1 Tax=Solibacillus sp. CAU 1738 TaxID=3140363 RepID=UPI0032601424
MKRQYYIRKQKRKRRTKKVALFTVALLCAIAVSFASLRIYAQIAGAPPITVPKASVFLDSQNHQIGDYYTSERRYWVGLDEISPYLIDATIAVEDKDFYEHSGFDFSRIAGAILADIKAGSKVQGASTLTQQYARNLYLTHEKTWTRKINEALYAYRLEIFYSKDEILEGYLNTVYYGHGMYGAEAASRYYFGKSASELTLAEAAMLAGIPKGPSIYSPIANIEKATNRQKLILNLMEEQQKITMEEKNRATSEQLVYKNSDWVTGKSIAPYFLDVVWKEASEILETKNLNVSEGGWTIKTTLNQAHQKAAEQAVQKNMPQNDLQAAFVSMDVDTGYVTALVGGRDYSTSSFNRVTLGKRQPGSAIKPILYAAALENGFTPMTFMDVSETTFTYDNGRATYKPQNVNGQFADHEMSLAQAIAISDNIYAVKTLEQIGYKPFREMLKRFNLEYTNEENPSIALGTIETTLYNLTSAYNTVAAGGEERKATTILSIENAKGEVVYKYKKPTAKRILSEQDAYLLTDMMTGIFDPVYSDYSPATGVSLRGRMTHTYAAKSGTTISDQWLIGYTPSITAGVWNGYDQGKTLSVQEDMAASKQVWIDFMETVNAGKANELFKVPAGVEGVVIDIETGKLATNACPKQRLVYLKKEDVPTDNCTMFQFFEPDSWGDFRDLFDFEAFRNLWGN